MKNTINLPDDEWEWYIGMLFSNIIKSFNLKNTETILEIAPGFRYKMAYALKEINFKGILYIIDSSDNVIDFINNKYKSILPDAKIITINKDIYNYVKYLPDVDLLVGNHIVDDLIIYNHINLNYNLKDDIQNNLFLAWKEIYDNDKYMTTINNTINLFDNLFEKCKFCILSQYKGNVYNKDNNYEDEITMKCFNNIRKKINHNSVFVQHSLNFFPFGDDERYLLPDLLANVQNEKRWIVGEPI